MESHAVIQSGDVVAGEYRVDRLLARGSATTVVAARHLNEYARFAIKIADASAEGRRAVERLERQLRASLLVVHENVAGVYELGVLDDGRHYLVMEYLQGDDLGVLHDERGPLALERAVDLVLQTCQGLAEAHGVGVVHRDVNPSHLFVTRDSHGRERIKLLDFGSAHFPGLLAEDRKSDPSRISLSMEPGTPPFVAPEQLLHHEHADSRSDIWSLGVLLYVLLSGKRPFAAESPARSCSLVLNEPTPSLHGGRNDIPPVLARIVYRCLEKDPGERFQDLSELAVSLAAFGSRGAMDVAQRVASSLVGAGIRPREALSTVPVIADLPNGSPDQRNIFRRETRKLDDDVPDPALVAALLAANARREEPAVEVAPAEPLAERPGVATPIGSTSPVPFVDAARTRRLRILVALVVAALAILAGVAVQRLLMI